MSTTDHEAIRRLIAHQAQLRDDNQVDEWAANWAPDATFAAGGKQIEGRAAIRASVGEADASRGWQGLHLLGQPVIDLAGDGATASTDFVKIVARADGSIAIAGVFRYRDELIRESGRWVFARREVEPKHRAP